MTISVQRFSTTADLLADEHVLPHLERWQSEGQRTALVTLVGVEGGAPRQPGAQMAVAEDGRSAGYLSGGCLEAAVVHEGQDAIKTGRNRLVRYGKGSPYFDIKLPCGSGLDLYIDRTLDRELIAAMGTHRAARRPFVLRTDLSSGASTVDAMPARRPLAMSRRNGDVFERVYAPSLRVLLFGNGPGLAGIAAIAATLGIEVQICSSDGATRTALAQLGVGAVSDEAHVPALIEGLDFASAAVLVFHEHDKELDVLGELLKTDCFYIGALGNHAVHRERLAALARRGVAEEALRRIRAPVGAIPAAKSKATLAIGVLAEMMAEAKALNLVA